jgi:hypothetical protein
MINDICHEAAPCEDTDRCTDCYTDHNEDPAEVKCSACAPGYTWDVKFRDGCRLDSWPVCNYDAGEIHNDDTGACELPVNCDDNQLTDCAVCHEYSFEGKEDKHVKCVECTDGFDLVRDTCVDPTTYSSVCTESLNCK